MGIARHWQPVLKTYIKPFTTARMSTVRFFPPRFWPAGLKAPPTPTQRPSDHSGTEDNHGHSEHGLRLSTSDCSCESGQKHRIKVILSIQVIFEWTLRKTSRRTSVARQIETRRRTAIPGEAKMIDPPFLRTRNGIFSIQEERIDRSSGECWLREGKKALPFFKKSSAFFALEELLQECHSYSSIGG